MLLLLPEENLRLKSGRKRYKIVLKEESTIEVREKWSQI